MSDSELRALERQILAAPSQLDLRWQHARLLQRIGEEDRALGALDLAWRLGADELWAELRPALEARRRVVGGLTLCWVPGGPFAMGADDLDADAAPLHVVHLSAFYVTERPITRADVAHTLPRDQYPFNVPAGPFREGAIESFLSYPLTPSSQVERVAAVESLPVPDGLAGRWSLITEAQWERVFRAALVTKDGHSPYGPKLDPQRPEWTADRYDAAAYGDGAPRRDPTGPAEGAQRVVRGVPGLPLTLRAVYREAATDDGSFEVPSTWWGHRTVRHEQGVAVRAVFLPGAS